MKDDIVKNPNPAQLKAVDGIVPAPPKEIEQKPEETTSKNISNTPPQPNDPNKPKSRGRKLPIALAVIVLLALASLAVYIGAIKKDNSSPNSSANNSQQTSQDNAEQNKQQADDIINDINNLQDDTDTSGDGLTDQNLGL